MSAAGILLADAHGELQVIAASDEHTRLLELFALQHDQGPCVECYRTGTARTNIDLTRPESAADWPRFAARARETGYVATHAIPLRLRSRVVGALNLFQTSPHVLDRDDIALAQALADVATIAILQQRTLEQSHVENSQLESALTSRILIEQVKGFWRSAGTPPSTTPSPRSGHTPAPGICACQSWLPRSSRAASTLPPSHHRYRAVPATTAADRATPPVRSVPVPGALTGPDKEHAETSMVTLHLLQSALVHVNTLLLQQVLAEPAWASRLSDEDRRGLTALFRSNLNPYGTFRLDMDKWLDLVSAAVPRPRTPADTAARSTTDTR